ncbi:MAG: hypothetical protein PSX36_05350 [bacterium]|nr:hypothetical protein [bacterium]
MPVLAQDKLFLTNGTIKHGIVVSISQDLVFFKLSDTSIVQKIPKNNLYLIEKYDGTRYLFSSATVNSNTASPIGLPAKRNFIGAQPFGVLFGRATVVYERLSKDGKIGLVIPFSLTYDPNRNLFKPFLDSAQKAQAANMGISFITGADVNFYFGKSDSKKFFIGPRIRYGTDIYLGGIEGYSIQTQVGWNISKPKNKVAQHLSLGFGFARILTAPPGSITDPKQSYGWGSVNYRISFKW